MTALGLGPQLDSLTQSCIIENVGDLRTVLESTNPLENLLRVERSSASYVVELLYKELQGAAIDDVYRKRCLKCLRGMGKRFHALPPSLFLNDITRSGDHPLTGGGFADIYKGQAGNLNVCLKVLRVHTAETERKKQKIIADFCQEALIWTQLRHPNVLSLLGVNTVLFSSGFCLVSPWMANGDIVSFLKEHPDHDKLQSICEIMAGLEYLHSFSPPIVHGDIKGDNILVSEDHRCVLADFGLATTSTETRSMKHTTSGVIRGSIRWMAPELYVGTDGASNDKKEDKTPRDTYAFACTVLEIMTGKPPFSNLTLDAAVIYQVSVRRIRPERPAEGWCPDHIWKLVELCWDEDPLKRPRAKALHSYLESLVLSGNSNPGEPGFIGYFNAINPPTCASAINGADTIDSDNPYGGRGQASDPRFSASLTPTTGLESRSNTPRTPGLPLPLHPKLPQTVNPNGIAKVEGIPAPRAPTASQYATEFFKLNERPIKDAVEHTGSYVVKLLDWGIHRPDQYIKGALEGLYIYSSILVTSLEVVARLHPVIGVTVVAFKLSIVSFYDKQIRDIAIVDLLIRIQQTMVLFLRLRYLSDPEDRGDDGQTIWDRLQELLVGLTIDIEGAGRAIDTAITDGIDVSSMNINYFQKFDGYQQALRRAFSHHPALSESFSAPSNPVKNVDSSKTEEHWETRIDSLVSQFQAPPSTSPDSSESPTGSPLSQTPSPHPLPQSAGHPRGLPLQSTRDKLKSSPRSYEVSSRTLHQFSSEFYQHRSANYGAHLEELPRPPTLPPSYLPSRRPLAGSSPSFQLTPPAAHGLTTALTLDSLLSHSTTILVFDLADDTFNPTPIGPPPDVHNDMASSPSSRASLLVPATSPPVSSIRLVLDDDDFVKPTSTIGLSQLEVKAVSSVSVRVTDVLEELYRALNHRITRSEWSQLNAEEKQHVSWEFYKRCSRSSQEQNVRDDGVKKVDFAKRTKLRCLIEAEGRKFKVMLE